MEAVARARFQRISPRKARVLINMVRGKKAAEALELLRFTRKSAARIVYKLIDSAISNIQHAQKSINLDDLIIKSAYVDKAPDHHMRRWRPRAFGRATRIVKGMSHITVVLGTSEKKK
ncbi:MAG: 50S ribosomal protein L22 [Sandaracinaceae bacterium]|nr:50S ribosomal protein L22 [Sandaracinaceae bacterium]